MKKVTSYSLIVNRHRSSWGYKCQNDKCVRIRVESSNSTARSLAICHLTCVDGGTMWPKPTGSIFIDKVLYNVDLEGFILEGPKSKTQKDYWIASRDRFRDLLDAKLPERSYLKRGGRKLLINIQLENDSLGNSRLLYIQILITIRLGLILVYCIYYRF